MMLTLIVAFGFVGGALAVAAWAARLPSEETSFLSKVEPPTSESRDEEPR
jgi:hypothetical protein